MYMLRVCHLRRPRVHLQSPLRSITWTQYSRGLVSKEASMHAPHEFVYYACVRPEMGSDIRLFAVKTDYCSFLQLLFEDNIMKIIY